MSSIMGQEEKENFIFSALLMGAAKLFLAALLIPVVVPAFAEISIYPDKTVIQCEPSCRVAAGELAKHLQFIMGGEVKINPEPEVVKDSYLIHFAVPPVDQAERFLPEEGRWLFTPEGAYFYGDGSSGALNAVYVFLENELGVRWPGGSEISFRKREAVVIRALSGAWHPDLRLREIRTGMDEHMALWSNRMLSGGHDIPRYGHAFSNWWEQYGKTHPEYFALNKGRRFPIAPDGSRKDDITLSNSKYSQMIALCVSNHNVVKQIIRNWDKQSNWINICENDAPANHSCHCENCLALDPQQGTELDNRMGADRYIHFANRVVAEAQQLRPGVKVTMYAYNATEQPPCNVRLSPDILLGIVPVDFRIDRLEDYLARWKAAGMREFFYRPNWHYYYCPMGFPIGNDKHGYDILKLMVDSGAVAFDFDAPAKFDVFRWRNDYILYHAMAHPERPFEYWEKHYGEAYGAACDDIIEYFRYWRSIWEKRIYPELEELANPHKNPYFSLIFLRHGRLGNYYTKEDFSKSGNCLERALGKDLTADDRRRVEAIKVFHEHAAVMLHAVQNRSAEATLAVKEFRRLHKMPPVMPYEEDLDDLCRIKELGDMSEYDSPVVDTPLLWHFRMDHSNEGEKREWYASRDFSKWDGYMPTDSSWEAPRRHYQHPSLELRRRTSEYDGVAWYGCEVKIPLEWKEERGVLLYFGAVDEAAEVWVNGHKAGSHPFVKADDWKTPFTMDISNLVDWFAKEQLLSVKVTDNAGAGGIWKRVYIVSRKRNKPVEVAAEELPAENALEIQLANAGFERANKDNACLAWNKNAQIHFGNPQAGGACAKQISNGSDWDAIMHDPVFRAEANCRYRLTVWNRNSLTGGTAKYGVRLINEELETISSVQGGYLWRSVKKGEDNWSEYQMDFTTPEGLAFLNIYFLVNQPVGDVFWDSVKIEKLVSEVK